MVPQDDDDDFKQQKNDDQYDEDVHEAAQKDERQAEDYDPPFSEPRDAVDAFPNTHQLHDNKSNIDEHEAYDEGADQAALDLSASNIDPTEATVADYDPEQKEEP